MYTHADTCTRKVFPHQTAFTLTSLHHGLCQVIGVLRGDVHQRAMQRLTSVDGIRIGVGVVSIAPLIVLRVHGPRAHPRIHWLNEVQVVRWIHTEPTQPNEEERKRGGGGGHEAKWEEPQPVRSKERLSE